jgi:hypothetical protein
LGSDYEHSSNLFLVSATCSQTSTGALLLKDPRSFEDGAASSAFKVSATVLIRALGPSLASAGIAGALADPVLELHDTNGVTLARNDNWKDTQQAEIESTTIPPSNDVESAIFATVSPGNYTAVVLGKNDATGIGLVEIYNLQ